MGWSELDNGKLLSAAETRFDVLVRTDQSLGYQQNLAGRRLALIVLPTTNWLVIREHVVEVAKAVDEVRAGSVVELRFPKIHG